MREYSGLCVGGPKAGQYVECITDRFNVAVPTWTPRIFPTEFSEPATAPKTETVTYHLKEWYFSDRQVRKYWVLNPDMTSMELLTLLEEGYCRYEDLKKLIVTSQP